MGIRQRIIAALKLSRVPMTAMQLEEATRTPLNSLSGELNRLANQGVLDRQDGFGPRGGYGYSLKDPDRWPAPRSAWTRIMSDDDF